MKSRFLDFKKYRTHDAVVWAVLYYCCGHVTSRDKVVGMCPHSGCLARKSLTLKVIQNSALAYCHCCHRPMDALELVKLSLATDYYTAAQALELMADSA